MNLSTLDWFVIIAYFVFVSAVGAWASRKSSQNTDEFFVGGRNMPWWLLGASMVATTFSADTPNLVTDIVRTHGVHGNWVTWAFLLTAMLTVFVYARLWRRSGVMTDLEFYEMRYSGKPAAFLRGFRAMYLGLFFNVMIMAMVSLAAVKIGGVLLGLSPFKTLLLAMAVTLVFCGLGGLRAVLWTDFILFLLAMFGSITAAVMACRLPQVGGLHGLFEHPTVLDKMHLFPVTRTADGWKWLENVVPVFVIPLAVQWWSAWYPGSEPGGGGYIAQRMLSARDEKGAVSATLLFAFCHYVLRPWPWIIVGLASLIVFPDLESIRQRFPDLQPTIIKNDIAYPAMLTLLPSGLIGIVVASLLAAYMSTMSTHLNWGASYMVNDVYHRFVRPQANEQELVMVGRISTGLLMIFAALMTFMLSNALQAFHLLLQIGAGTGLIFILRWFWWRINAWTEITGMAVSFLFAFYIEIVHPWLGFSPWPVYQRLLAGVGITTACWYIATLLTHPADKRVLRSFYRLVRPGGPGWGAVLRSAEQDGEPIEKNTSGDLPIGILCMLAGTVMIYSFMFMLGYALSGKALPASLFLLSGAVGLTALIILKRKFARSNANSQEQSQAGVADCYSSSIR